jgi:hypothetical protein
VKIDMEDGTLDYMLGYLEPGHWVSAIEDTRDENSDLNEKVLWNLLEVISKKYNRDPKLIEEVRWKLKVNAKQKEAENEQEKA